MLNPDEIQVRGDVIRLGQLLQVAGWADTGGEAKALLAEAAITVNGEPENRRGRQLRPGDEIRLGDRVVRLV